MNLFQNILNKAGTFGQNFSLQGVAKLAQKAEDKYKIGDRAYEAANASQDPIQRFLDDSTIDSTKKQALLTDLQTNRVPLDVVKSYISDKYYGNTFGNRVITGLGNRFKTAEESLNTNKSTIEKGASLLKDVIATPFDIVGAGIQPVVEPVLKPIMETAPVQYGMEKYGQFREANPRLAQNIEAGAGILSSVAPFTKTGQAVIKAPGKAVVAGVEKVAPKVVQGVKKITPTLPKAEELLVNQLEKTNRMNPTKYTEFEQMAGQRAGKFLADRKITGDAETNVAKLYENFTKSKAEADKGLGAIEKTYKPSEVPPAFNDMLGELEKRFTYTKDNANLAKVQEYKGKLANGTLSHNDINGTKRLYEQKVKVNYIKDQNSLEVERATNIDNDVRTWQFDEAEKLGFGNLKEINKETQLNRYLADNIGDKIARGAGLNNISLTDWIIAGQIPATPQAFALFAGKKFAEKATPKLYQKGLEKIAKMPKKEAPLADIENINKMEAIRKSVTPQYDTNRLLVSPRSSSRSPKSITPEVTLPKGEKALPTTKSPAIKSDITSKSKIVRPNSVKPSPQVKPVEKTVVKPKNAIYNSLEQAESYVKFYEKQLMEKGLSKKDISYLKKGLETAKKEVEMWKSPKPLSPQKTVKPKK